MYSVALREQQGKVAYDMSAILAACEKENNRGLTQPEREKYDALMIHYDSLESDIVRAEKAEKAEKYLNSVSNPTRITGSGTGKAAVGLHPDAIRVRAYARKRGLVLTNAAGVPVDEDPQSDCLRNGILELLPTRCH